MLGVFAALLVSHYMVSHNPITNRRWESSTIPDASVLLEEQTCNMARIEALLLASNSDVVNSFLKPAVDTACRCA
ncbi:hypothetical protein PVK06_027746 [Gossypium arboreum]|uniref:Uncharacterized protein n=1 Tax=Gossypium arboreum TaxID=29729 RepID=A0ABR0P1K8_GOSAR|nr:hypothetical protein PVK06_027746 [Gossypium arboreum]